MAQNTIRQVRAYVARGGGGDYHDQGKDHWIDGHVATPMAKYPAYRDSRQSFGLNVLGSLIVEIEADNGVVGFAVSTGGEPGAWIVEHHLARFLEGAKVADIEVIWEQMYFSTLFYGRKGLVINAISCVDLALWDLLGKLRQEPVYHLLGGAVRDELIFYATGSRPDLAKQLGFIGGKMPLLHCPAEGDEGLQKNIARLAEMRAKTGDDFWLMYDCWMSLDLDYAVRLAHAAAEYGLKWMEEALLPDDYWGTQSSEAKCRVACYRARASMRPHDGASVCSLKWNVPIFCSRMWDGAEASRSLRKYPRSPMHMEFWSYLMDPACIAITS